VAGLDEFEDDDNKGPNIFMAFIYSVTFIGNMDGREKGPRGTNTRPVSRIRRIVDGDGADDEEHSSMVRMRLHKEAKNGGVDPPSASTAVFPSGALVELYGPGSASAFPAIVKGVSVTGAGAARYRLKQGIVFHDLRGVESTFVHEYQIYLGGDGGRVQLG